MKKNRIKPLAEVKDKIIQSLKEIKARQRVKRIIKRIHQEAQQDQNLIRAAEAYQLKLK